jgi:large subunit ribosomal protein L32
MAVPKSKTTKTKRNMRRSHHALTTSAASVCPNCKRAVRPHQMCMACGYYGGREVEDVFAKLTKRERKKRERQEAHEREEREAQQATQADN